MAFERRDLLLDLAPARIARPRSHRGAVPGWRAGRGDAGLDWPGPREACLGAGAAAYVTKPIRRDDLATLIGAP